MSSRFKPHSRFARVLSVVAATLITGAMFGVVLTGITSPPEQAALVAAAPSQA
jgi:hypothetical protein